MSLIHGLDELYGKDKPLIRGINKVLTKFPDLEPRIAEAISRGQIQSKLWLIETLNEIIDLNSAYDDQTIFIEAGWYGFLALLLFEKAFFNIGKIRSFDIDPSCAPVADTLLKPWILNDWQFKATTMDIMQICYDPYVIYETLRNDGSPVELTDRPAIIINTSCEHIANFKIWMHTLPKNTLIVLQSNNLEHPEHVTRAESLRHFENLCTDLKTIVYSGEKVIEEAGYTRFMIIGYK